MDHAAGNSARMLPPTWAVSGESVRIRIHSFPPQVRHLIIHAPHTLPGWCLRMGWAFAGATGSDCSLHESSCSGRWRHREELHFAHNLNMCWPHDRPTLCLDMSSIFRRHGGQWRHVLHVLSLMSRVVMASNGSSCTNEVRDFPHE